jgi:hypothetical protein
MSEPNAKPTPFRRPKGWRTFDPAATMAIVFSWPDGSITMRAAKWLFSLVPPANVEWLNEQGRIDDLRDRVVWGVCLKAPPWIKEFLFIDRDMEPDLERGSLEPFIQAAGDVVGALYPMKDDRCWAAPHQLHCGLLRVKRYVLEALAAERAVYNGTPVPVPFFRFEAGLCECEWFIDRVRKHPAKFIVTRAGWCGHWTREQKEWAHGPR